MDTMLLSLLRKRRSIRQFTRQPVAAEQIDLLIEAALRTPTSRARNPWEFVVVTDPLLLKELASAKQQGSAFLADAPLAIVVAADPQASDVWTEDCSIAAMVIQLTAEELGLGSCWVQIRLRPHTAARSSEDFVKELLALPPAHVVECIIAIGYPGEAKPGHLKKCLPFDRVHRQRYAH